MPPASLVYVFGHGQFIQAARTIVADADLDERAKMRDFWRKGEPPAISNAQRLGFHWDGDRWACSPAIAASINTRSPSSSVTPSGRRSYSWVVRVELWFPILGAVSNVPPFSI